MKITTRFDWHCDLCGVVITDGDGYIHVDHLAALEARNEAANIPPAARGPPEGDMVTLDIVKMPTIIGWQVHHRDCDPWPSDPDYWIDVDRARTLNDMLDWNAHLHGKNWIGYTDWDRFIRRGWAADAAGMDDRADDARRGAAAPTAGRPARAGRRDPRRRGRLVGTGGLAADGRDRQRGARARGAAADRV